MQELTRVLSWWHKASPITSKGKVRAAFWGLLLKQFNFHLIEIQMTDDRLGLRVEGLGFKV